LGFCASLWLKKTFKAYDAAMRVVLIAIAMALLLLEWGGITRRAAPIKTVSAATVPAASDDKARIDFDTQLKPIFQSKCMPCHFSGGKVYDRLPFDNPATIRKLGTRLFTRIKDEHDRRLIDDFLTQSP
jgi:hypothetical protein